MRLLKTCLLALFVAAVPTGCGDTSPTTAPQPVAPSDAPPASAQTGTTGGAGGVGAKAPGPKRGKPHKGD
jgi:hypothetical protein